MPAHAQSGHQLLDAQAALIACEREHHEVTHFNVALLEHARKRVLGLTKSLECFFTN